MKRMDKSSKTILVIDDSEVALEVIKDDLTEAGYSVLTAGSSQAAQDIIFSGYRPDLIFLDVMMPGMNGDEFCQLIKGHPESKNIPIIFVSTKEESELKQMIKEAGANGYLRKAMMTTEDLIGVIEGYLKK